MSSGTFHRKYTKLMIEDGVTENYQSSEDSVRSSDSIETESKTNINKVIRDFFPETWLWQIETLKLIFNII